MSMFHGMFGIIVHIIQTSEWRDACNESELGNALLVQWLVQLEKLVCRRLMLVIQQIHLKVR